MRKFFGTIKAGIMDFLEDECMVSGAALAYYTIFSLPPLLVLVFYIAGWFGVSEAKINDIVSRQIGMPIAATQPSGGGESASSLEGVAHRQSSEAQPLQALGPVSKILGAAILIFSATGVFAQLQRALNRAWEVEPDPEKAGWKDFLAKRGLSLGMIVVIAFLLLVSLVITTLVDEAAGLLLGQPAGAVGTAIGIIINNVVALAVATLLFAAMYKICTF